MLLSNALILRGGGCVVRNVSDSNLVSLQMPSRLKSGKFLDSESPLRVFPKQRQKAEGSEEKRLWTDKSCTCCHIETRGSLICHMGNNTRSVDISSSRA